MTTTTAFKPPPNNSFTFQPTLDGQTCTAIVWWNVDGQRWFVSAYGSGGASLFNVPLVGSPPTLNLESISWANGTVTVETEGPHGFKFLSTVDVTVSGCSPFAYNGTFPCFIVSPTRFIYQLVDKPGDATVLGAAGYDINLGAGYLASSTVVFREQSQTFEVSP